MYFQRNFVLLGVDADDASTSSFIAYFQIEQQEIHSVQGDAVKLGVKMLYNAFANSFYLTIEFENVNKYIASPLIMICEKNFKAAIYFEITLRKVSHVREENCV